MASFAGVLFAAVVCLSAFGDCVLLDDFYPFGKSVGDEEMLRGDDRFSSPLQLEMPFPYYDREESILYVSRCLFLAHASTSKGRQRTPFV